MSGELSNPKDQIPKGVLSALAVSALAYLVTTFWFAYSASSEALIDNTLLIADLAWFEPLVIVGILSATASSALTTLVAAPRILQALGSNSVLPWSGFFAAEEDGEPRNATLVTILIVASSLLFRNLNSVAPVLTMFFLLTYGVINLVVYIEQSLGLVSFRPTLSIPKIIPLYGAVSSIVFMVYINVIAGLVALGFLFFTYSVLVQRRLEPQHGDVRSGLFMALAEWAAKQVIR
ncbi:MAG: amino acid permease, partial [Halobacteriaceae archaeon]